MKKRFAVGIGFREGATMAALLEALARAGHRKGEPLGMAARHLTHPLIFALELAGYRLTILGDAVIAGTPTLTQSAIALSHYNTGSLAEACALLAAGPGARLLAPRCFSSDRMASAARAEVPLACGTSTGDPE